MVRHRVGDGGGDTMRGWVFLGLLACGGSKDPSDSTISPGTGTSVVNTTASGSTVQTTPPPALESPAEATDLDPDPGVLHVALTAAPQAIPVGDETIDGYAYNGQVPGPTLRAMIGDTLRVDRHGPHERWCRSPGHSRHNSSY